MIQLSFKAAKEGFFDRKKVLDAVDKATYRIFFAFGRQVRARAQRSLQYSEKPSSPGQPPHAHRSHTIARVSRKTGQVKYSAKTGQALKRSVSFLREYLFFAYDKTTKSVVIGPALLNSTLSRSALSALEYGGQSVIIDHGKRKQVRIKARPFMGPAAKAEIPTLPSMWQNSVR